MTEGNGEVRELPKGWVITKLGKVCEVVRGGSPRPMGNPKYFSGSIPFIKIADITKVKDKTVFDAETKVNEEGSKKSRLLPKGTLILSNSGTVCIPKFLGVKACIDDGFVSFLNLLEEINKDYLFYYFQYLRPYVVQKHKQGITQVNLNIEIVSDFDLKLPPTNEQHRIVEKIEELFSDLDQGIENLKTAQKQLKVYRQAVLKSAFEGKLTEKWRSQIQQEKLDIKTGEELLAQIKAERENRYQQQLAEWEEAVQQWEAIGRIGRKPTKAQKFRDLPLVTQAELTELAQLPAGWCWINFGELVSEGPQNGLYKPASQYGGGVLIVRIDNFYDGKLNGWTTFKRLQVSDDELEIYRLEGNDILINRVNSMTYIGKCAFVEKIGEDCVFESNVMRVKIFMDFISPKFISYYLSSIFGLKELRKNAKQAVNQASINQTDVCLSRVPLCSLEEQQQILQEIESRLSICDQLEATIIENLQKAEALRQSIFKQAFEGKLVPQDPNDEPAEKLLERIKQEKFNRQKGKQLSIQGM